MAKMNEPTRPETRTAAKISSARGRRAQNEKSRARIKLGVSNPTTASRI